MQVGQLSVVISGDNRDLLAALSQADAATQKTTKSTGSLSDQISSSIKRAFAATAIFEFVRSTLTAGMQYQQAMNQFQAASKASADEMQRAGKIAEQLGNDTQIPAASAKDAADAMLELAKGGLSASQSMDAARGTLLLAAAAGTDAATAATMTSDALNAFGLSGDQAGHVADVLAGAANNASGEISDFAQASQQVATVASQLGISLDDTGTALTAFAKNGLKGSDAGTSLKTMLTSLLNPSKQGAAALDELGVKAFDAQGNFVGLEALSGQLATAQGRMTTETFNAAAATAFGTDAVRAAAVMAKTGAQGFADLEKQVTASGNAAEMAGAKAKGLAGAWDAFKSTVQGIQIDMFKGASTDLESLVRKATTMLPQIGQLISEVGSSAMKIFALVAQVGVTGFMGILKAASPLISLVGNLAGALSDLPTPILAAAAAMLLMNRNAETIAAGAGGVKQFATSVQQLGWTYQTARESGMTFGESIRTASLGATGGVGVLKSAGAGLMSVFGGPLGLAVTGVSVALGIMTGASEKAAAAQRENAQAAKNVATAMKESNGAINDNVLKASQAAVGIEALTKAMGGTKTIGKEVSAALDEAGISTEKLISDFPKGATAMAPYIEKLRAVAAEHTNTAGVMDGTGATAKDLADHLSSLSGEADNAKQSSSELAGASEIAATKADGQAKSVSELTGDLKELVAAQDEASGKAISEGEAHIKAAEAADDLTAAIAKNGATHDLSTQAGQDNQKQLYATADAFNAERKTMLDNGAAADVVIAKQKQQRDEFIKGAQQMGYTADEAKALADQVIGIPSDKEIKVAVTAAAAQQTLDIVKGKVVSITDKSITVSALTDAAKANLTALGYKVETMPDGTTKITAETEQAQANLAATKATIDSYKDKYVTIYVRTEVQGSPYDANSIPGGGGKRSPRARGSIDLAGSPLRFMAAGGMVGSTSNRRISPMLSRAAQIVAPSTMKQIGSRVVGDRTDVPELFAPLDGSARTLALMNQAESMMGRVAMTGDQARALARSGAGAMVRQGDSYSSSYSFNITAAPNIPTEKQIRAALADHDSLYRRRVLR